MKLEVKAYAAGSLRKVLPEIFNKIGILGEIEFGPSGVLKERIVNGEQVDLFFPANMQHAQSLFELGLSNMPQIFAHNELCLFGKSDILTNNDALNLMLDPQYRLGTSTPIDDPGGDYAFAVFDKADSIQKGATDKLREKALPLVGGRNSKIKDGSHSPVYVLFKASLVDMFLGYRTTAIDISKYIDDILIVDLPDSLQIRSEYGVVVVNGSNKGQLALKLLQSPEIEEILIEYGFSS
ncbi:substrate-binding domain-containing protein [Maridesulfovibrio zosterae]|uniref:substrate-binding domain-containing protein n=1 Tax=Maridesulfovibrio zosterae TaxID=82171 RepID=UPI0003FBF82B|nr:substrate-binding domain-containing protein [Maridesulfovibrio zosterae]